MKERTIRLDLNELENILKAAGILRSGEHLNDAHIEPNELVLRVLSEDVPSLNIENE
jgi:hypothetical protein